MKYEPIRIANKVWWMASPSNWEELAFTIHNEPEVLLPYNPNDLQPNTELLNLFL